jgi:glycine dehydrogenase subunit 2
VELHKDARPGAEGEHRHGRAERQLREGAAAGTYRIPYDGLCKHEVVVQPPKGKKALDVAKGLIDHGYHPPTIYFPLVVKEAMLIEPTETESKETLDDFIGTMLELAESTSEELEEAPVSAPTKRLDEARAARQLKARW